MENRMKKVRVFLQSADGTLVWGRMGQRGPLIFPLEYVFRNSLLDTDL